MAFVRSCESAGPFLSQSVPFSHSKHPPQERCHHILVRAAHHHNNSVHASLKSVNLHVTPNVLLKYLDQKVTVSAVLSDLDFEKAMDGDTNREWSRVSFVR